MVKSTKSAATEGHCCGLCVCVRQEGGRVWACLSPLASVSPIWSLIGFRGVVDRAELNTLIETQKKGMHALHYSRDLPACLCTFVGFKLTRSISGALIWSGIS